MLSELGERGGIISPSIYDTAQVIRFYPPKNIWQAINWLLEQQHPDGGWGNPTTPRARDVPTLAVLLAIHSHNHRGTTQKAIRAGTAFLRRQSIQWGDGLPTMLPVAIELLLPRLLEEATAARLPVTPRPYKALIELGERRLNMIRRIKPVAGTPAVHSWEAWGTTADLKVLDATGGVGHSPAATAAWLHVASNQPRLTKARRTAEQYLQRAAAASSTIPGVVPTVWPIHRFEQSFALYALAATGLLQHPQLEDIVKAQIANLAEALTPAGVGMSDTFMADGDDTAAAILVHQVAGVPVDLAILRQFKHQTLNHFVAYAGELQSSLSLTARAIHALNRAGEDTEALYPFVLERQQTDGRWPGDKWHSSWLYNTYHAVLALQGSPYYEAIAGAVDAFLAYQQEDGSWGRQVESCIMDTTYAVLALKLVDQYPELKQASRQALRRAHQWLLNNYRPFNIEGLAWVGKEVYQPYRIDLTFQLCAMLVLSQDQELYTDD